MTAHGKGWKPRPLSLSDSQLQIIMRSAAMVDPDRRGLFLQRVSAALKLRGTFADRDVEAAVQVALQGLLHDESAA